MKVRGTMTVRTVERVQMRPPSRPSTGSSSEVLGETYTRTPLLPGLRVPPPPVHRAWDCETCGKADTAGAHAPGRWTGEAGVHRYDPGPWECLACSRTSWGAYLQRKRDRLALITVSEWLGYPARMADVERFRNRGQQVAMEALWTP